LIGRSGKSCAAANAGNISADRPASNVRKILITPGPARFSHPFQKPRYAGVIAKRRCGSRALARHAVPADSIRRKTPVQHDLSGFEASIILAWKFCFSL
jgi:hypothetical protein